MWGWIKSVITDPASLAAELERLQNQRGEDCRPLRDRVAVVDDLLAGQQRQLEKLLDLYLTDGFDKSVLTDRREKLQETVTALQSERARLAEQIAAQTLTDEQVETIAAFTQRVLQGLKVVQADFETQRRLIDLLEVGVTLVIDGDEKVANLECIAGDSSLSIATTAISG